MSRTRRLPAIMGMLLSPVLAWAQGDCLNGVRVQGTITDPTGAVVSGAQVEGNANAVSRTNDAGHYDLACLVRPFTLHIQAEGLAEKTVTGDAGRESNITLDIQLALASVETRLQVSGNDSVALDASQVPDSVTLDTQMVKQ